MSRFWYQPCGYGILVTPISSLANNRSHDYNINGMRSHARGMICSKCEDQSWLSHAGKLRQRTKKLVKGRAGRLRDHPLHVACMCTVPACHQRLMRTTHYPEVFCAYQFISDRVMRDQS